MIGERRGPGTAGVPAWFPRGLALLREPTLNKGTAFTESERAALGIRGLLPPRAMTQDIQVARVLENFRKKTSNLEKYINLNALHDRNEALFYRVVSDHPDEMMPIDEPWRGVTVLPNFGSAPACCALGACVFW